MTNTEALKEVYNALGGNDALEGASNLDVLNAIAELNGGTAQDSNAKAIKEIADNPPSGGGSGDFTSATLLYSSEQQSVSVTIKAPVYDEDSGATVSESYYAGYEQKSLDLVLYKGKAYIFVDGEISTISGDIELDEDGYYFVTGDCSIVFS